MYKLCVLIIISLLAGCAKRVDLAPVVELKWQPYNPHQTTYIVKKNETLYAIAFRFDQDYRQLATINHLQPPYNLHVGQILRVRRFTKNNQPKRMSRAVAKVIKRPTISASHPQEKQRLLVHPRQTWLWPTNGQILTKFAPQLGKKGIDIAGKKGEKIYAASDGVVAYSGNGLAGYGNLIIIKHNGQFLTAYANNSHNRVMEGQKIKAGQIIAEMGIIDRHYWGVHFEIRKAGKPVNPLDYLKPGLKIRS